MAFNWQTFKTRSLTAAVFVVVMLVGLLWNHWSFFILFSIVHFGCWWEYQRLIGLIDNRYTKVSPFHKYGVMIAGWCIMLYFTNDSFNLFGLRLHELGWWMGLIAVFLLPILELLFAKHIDPKVIGYSFFGLIYISLSLGLLIDLINTSDTRNFYYLSRSYPQLEIPLTLIASLWINDTMAYLIGSLIGKTPFSKVSPKKTWEGTIGGVLLCVIVVFIIWYLISKSISNSIVYAAMSFVVAVTGTMGDLLKSKLKRMAGVKDSGSFMPGHGGFLDRFDSLILATPFVWLFVHFMG